MRIAWRLAFLLLLVAPPLWAEGGDEKTESARAHLRSGVAWYVEGRYDDAAREMEAAYALKPLPDLQYNLAQCYERLGRLPDAARAYHLYLDGKPQAEDHKLIAARVQNIEDRIRQEKAGVAAPAPPPATEKVVFKTIVVYREAPPAPGRGARFAAYTLGVLAVAGLASGITFAVLAGRKADLVSKGGSATSPVLFAGSGSGAQATGQTSAVVAGVSFGMAVLGAAGAVGLYLFGQKIDREAPRLTFAPALSPSGGGFAIAGSF